MTRETRNLFINREMSWLEFNYRVLEEALDETAPLLERLKFLAIFSSNLDEFFMVRVAGIKRQIEAEVVELSPDGMAPRQQDSAISRRVHAMVDRQYDAWNRHIRPALAQARVVFASPADLSASQKRFLARWFADQALAVLTPMAVDRAHPFPTLLNANLYIAVRLKAAGVRHIRGASLAFVQVPEVLPRVVDVPSGANVRTLVFLEDVISEHIATVFEGYEILSSHRVRVTRDADLTIDEEGAEDLLKAIEYELRRRPRGAALRLEIDKGAPAALVEQLMKALDIGRDDVYPVGGPLNLKPLMGVAAAVDRPDLKDPVFPPVPTSFGPDRAAVWRRISRGDILLHHPYESFDAVVEFLEAAADDPDVLAIKQTLYRTAGDSPIVKALARAALKGKEVTALVELKARFDEGTNIEWARMLEEAGANVIYGLVGLKTHCKAALVVRRERGGIKRYLHVATGNYNEVTARVYTDVGLLTADEDFGADASALFNVITGYSQPPRFRRLSVAPLSLKERVIELIDREAGRARSGVTGRIIAKMNSLVDREVIEALYRASKAGVAIDLIVRGICCLRPGVQGAGDNIRVISIVDRFLEHSRIFYFHNGGQDEYYLSSADWMPRNLLRRIELMFPLSDEAHKAAVREILDVELADTVKARELLPDGSYRRVRGKKALRSQEELYRRARTRYEESLGRPSEGGPRFIPRKAESR
jgi:polyphosphate kinase